MHIIRHIDEEAEVRASGLDAMVAHLKLLIAKLRQERFGASAERGARLDQLELQLEELEAAASEDRATAVTSSNGDRPEPGAPSSGTASRRPLRDRNSSASAPVVVPASRMIVSPSSTMPFASTAMARFSGALLAARSASNCSDSNRSTGAAPPKVRSNAPSRARMSRSRRMVDNASRPLAQTNTSKSKLFFSRGLRD